MPDGSASGEESEPSPKEDTKVEASDAPTSQEGAEESLSEKGSEADTEEVGGEATEPRLPTEDII